MTQKEIECLREGDVVIHRTGDAYVVIDGFRKIAVRTIWVSNPEEWEFKEQDGDAYNVRQHRIEIDVLTKRVDSTKKEIAELKDKIHG